MADTRPRHRSKCPVCTKLMRGGEDHPNKCRTCHGYTIDIKCDTCSKWTDIVWAGIVERSQARLSRKRRAIDKPAMATATLRKEPSHKDNRARFEPCSISSGSFLGFLPVPSPSPEIIQNRESMLEEILYLLREQRSVPNVVNNTTNRPSASGGTAPTCTLDGMARIIDNVNILPIGLPTRVTEQSYGSLSQQTYAEGPSPGEKPEKNLCTKSPDGSPEPEPNPEIELVRPGSPNDRELPKPDDNPRRHTVQLVSPGPRRNARPASVRGQSHESFNQSEPAEGRFRSRSPVRTFYEPPICVPARAPTSVTRTSWSSRYPRTIAEQTECHYGEM